MASLLTEDLPSPPQDSSTSLQPANVPVSSATYPHDLFLNFPWCPSCGPLIRTLLAHAFVTDVPSGHSRPEPFADSEAPDPLAAFVPILVHRSQLPAVISGISGPTNACDDPDVSLSQSGPTASVRMSTQPTVAPDNVMTPPRRPRGVKVACTNCRRSNKKCDEGRPCQRCIRGHMEDACTNPSPKPLGARPRVARNVSSGRGIDATTTSGAVRDASLNGGQGLQLSEDTALYFSSPAVTPGLSTSSSHYDLALAFDDCAEHNRPYLRQTGEGFPIGYANYFPDTPPSWPPTVDLSGTWGTPDPRSYGSGASESCGWGYPGPFSG